MKSNYDYTLIDSRTGLSDIADICTVHLPDILVDCFTLNNQSIEGAAEIARVIDDGITTGTSGSCRSRRGLTTRKRRNLTLAGAWPDGGSINSRGTRQRGGGRILVVRRNPLSGLLCIRGIARDLWRDPGSPLSLLASYERLTAAITEDRSPRSSR